MPKYSDKLLNYFYHLDHAGRLDNAIQYKVGSKSQGDQVELFLLISSHVIEQARFQCFGSVPSVAACEFICRWLEGKTINEAQKLTLENILLELDLSPLHNHVANRVLQCFRGIVHGYLQS